jgi:N-methylhydantoinase B
MGAWAQGHGLSGVQTHMTNTLNTPIEVLESRFPLRITRYEIRPGSGGAGAQTGGDGLIRRFEFLAPTTISLLSERRTHAPWGMAGGQAALPGCNLLGERELPGKIGLRLKAGQQLTIKTAGGGGYGTPRAKS